VRASGTLLNGVKELEHVTDGFTPTASQIYKLFKKQKQLQLPLFPNLEEIIYKYAF
jgi:hypothetical protein